MPAKGKTTCSVPGCGALITVGEGKCTACRRASERERGTAHQRLYDARWQRESRWFLSRHPLCICNGGSPGCNGVARVVDHKTPHRGDRALFWDQSNWQPMSKHCHDVKTVQEDGGFGRQRGEGYSESLKR